jgi:putative transposase
MHLLFKCLQVSKQGYYAWRKRKPSKRAEANSRLLPKIKAISKASDKTYGSPRIKKELNEAGIPVGRRRVARLMKLNDVAGVPKKKYRVTTNSGHDYPVSKNLLRRDFEASRPNEKWVGDITYIRTWEGWLYLSVVIDLFSRRVVGWCMGSSLGQELVNGALEMAIGRRQLCPGLIFHSDRGIQYASSAHRVLLRSHGILSSMSRKGDCWDNAVSESFFATLKRELIDRSSWTSRDSARSAIVRYIELFYNAFRRHSFIGLVCPNEFERGYEMRKAA